LELTYGIFLVLHGLVHLFYFGQSQRFFELQPGMIWPDNSWAFSGHLGVQRTRVLASLFCLLAAVGFVTAGIVVFLDQSWWKAVVIGSAAFSSAILVVFWDKRMKKLHDRGGIGILLNLAILVALAVFDWPSI